MNVYSYIATKQVQKKGKDRGVEANVLDCSNIVSEFELHSRYYVHFETNTLWKYMNPLICPLKSDK